MGFFVFNINNISLHLVVFPFFCIGAVLSGCGCSPSTDLALPRAADGPLQILGKAAALFTETPGNPMLSGHPMVETSLVAGADGEFDLFFTLNSGLHLGFLSVNKVNELQRNASLKPTSIFSINRSYVFSHQGIYYALGTLGGNTGSIFLWKSMDKQDWQMINDGRPILTPSPDPNSNWHLIWNVAVAPCGGKWHLLAETAPDGIDQAGMGLSYSVAEFKDDRIDFNPGRGQASVIERGGNPWLGCVAKTESLIAIHGMSVDPKAVPVFGAEWYVTASAALSLPTAGTSDGWSTVRDRFSIGRAGVAVCDPHLLDRGEGHSPRLLLSLSYGQDRAYLLQSDASLDDVLATLFSP